MTQGSPISYKAASRGTPVLSRSGKTIGTLEHVLEVRDLDIFEGIVGRLFGRPHWKRKTD